MNETRRLDNLLEKTVEILEHEPNVVYGTTMLHKCCVCDTYRMYDGSYVKIHKALDAIFRSNEHYEISHGYCEKCASVEKDKIRQHRKGL